MQGDEDPNVVSSLKVPSIKTNPHLKWKRDPCNDSTDSLPAKWKPMIISVSFFWFSLFLFELTTLMQEDEDPNVVSSLKIPSVETNSHLKQKRDFRDDPTDSPPAKWTPVITSVGFSSFSSFYLGSQLWCRGTMIPTLYHPWNYQKPIVISSGMPILRNELLHEIIDLLGVKNLGMCT